MGTAFRTGKGTRDLSGPSGLTTEKFVDAVAEDLAKRMATGTVPAPYTEDAAATRASRNIKHPYVDQDAMQKFFNRFDVNGDGDISFEEFVDMTMELGIAPLKAEAVQKKMQNDRH